MSVLNNIWLALSTPNEFVLNTLSILFGVVIEAPLSLYLILLMSGIHHSSFTFKVGQHGSRTEIFTSGNVRPAPEFITCTHHFTCQPILKKQFITMLQIIKYLAEVCKSLPYFIIGNNLWRTVRIFYMLHLIQYIFQLFYFLFRLLHCTLHLFRLLFLVHVLFALML